MKKYGKYEKRPEGVPVKQPKVKSALLQTYLTSLLCMVLCVTMFFGTSFAWFTSEVENTGNEIHIGILDVDLLLGEKSLKNNSTDKVFDNTIFWEPGYTALRTLAVKNEGNLAFHYELMLTSGKALDKEDVETDLENVAKHFFVYIHAGNYATGETKPEAFKDIKESDKWVPVMHEGAIATLADILDPANDIAIAQGDITTEDGSNTYIVALHMDENAGSDIMGHQINMNVKLVAYQKGYEKDDFDNSQYDDVAFAATSDELQAALDKASGETVIVLADDITGDVTVTQKEGVNTVIDGNGKTLTGSILVDGKSSTSDTAGLTIKNVNFVNSKKETPAIDAYLEPSNTTRYARNLTVEDCTFTMTGEAHHTAVAVDLYQPYNFTMKNCTVTGAHSVLQNKGGHDGITVDNVTATDCKNGIGLGTMDGEISISNCKMDLVGYGIRIDGSQTSKGVTISDCEIKAEIPVVVRKATGTYTITFTGKNTMTQTNTEGLWFAAGIKEYGDVDKAGLEAVTGTITVKLEGTGLDAAGVYIAEP